MRKIIVMSMISLDGVIQAPGGPEEDVSGGFRFGGWVAPFSDEDYRRVVQEELQPADYLLGRKTYEIWAPYWPGHGDFWPGINEGMKYVLTRTLNNVDPVIAGWEHTQVIRGVEDIRQIREGEGRDLHVWGSSELVQLLMEHDLVDDLRLKIHPVILGGGKRLFNEYSLPARYELVSHLVTGKGVIISHYKRIGQVETGAVQASI